MLFWKMTMIIKLQVLTCREEDSWQCSLSEAQQFNDMVEVCFKRDDGIRDQNAQKCSKVQKL